MALLVRRRGIVAQPTGFDPLTLSPLLWLKADAITGLANNDPVTTWTDSSMNARDFSQATASRKPLYKTNQLNGMAGVLTDGVDDYLSFELGSQWITTTTLTVAMVGRRAAAQANGRAVSIDNGGDDYNNAESAALFEEGSTATQQGTYRVGVRRAEMGTNLGDGVPWCSIARCDGSTSYIRRNGTNGTTAADVVGAFGVKRFVLGQAITSVGPWNGYYFEVLAFNSFVTGANLTSLDTYLRSKWNV
jgi:hypothetical protein